MQILTHSQFTLVRVCDFIVEALESEVSEVQTTTRMVSVNRSYQTWWDAGLDLEDDVCEILESSKSDYEG